MERGEIVKTKQKYTENVAAAVGKNSINLIVLCKRMV